VAGAVGSTALGSHFGASLEDHGPNVVLYGQVHRLPDAPEAYGAMITRAKAAPAQSRSTDLVGSARHRDDGTNGTSSCAHLARLA
jgi:hypothetical protein